jgi:prepilin peptidase CpaA
MLQTAAHLTILGAFLAVAAAADVVWRRIPNALVAPLAVAGVAAQWISAGPFSAGRGVLAGLAVVAVFLFPWSRGMIGGGDVKLAAAVAVWLGPERLVPFLLYAGAAALPVALATRLSHRLALRRIARSGAGAAGGVAGDLAVPAETVPLAVAIGLGALAALRWSLP